MQNFKKILKTIEKLMKINKKCTCRKTSENLMKINEKLMKINAKIDSANPGKVWIKDNDLKAL